MHDTLILLQKVKELLVSYAKEAEPDKSKELAELIQRFDDYIASLAKEAKPDLQKIVINAGLSEVIRYLLKGIFDDIFK